MSDLEKRLRVWGVSGHTKVLYVGGVTLAEDCITAAEELETLRAEHAKLREELERAERFHERENQAEEIGKLREQRDRLVAFIPKIRDIIEAQDGVSVESEAVVDDYRAILADIEGEKK